LRQRDFTINAIATPLSKIVELLATGNVVAPFADTIDQTFIDPINGLSDIHKRQLRAVEDPIFKHDPLRMLRAVRFRSRYQLSINPWTERLIKRDARLLLLAANERIHDELYAILTQDGATDQLRYLDTLGLLTILIPEFIPARGMPQPKPHYWDVLEHSLETVRALEKLASVLRHDATFSEDFAEIRSLLHDAEQQGIFQFASLTAPSMKLAALLHDIGKPSTYSMDIAGNIHFYDHPQVGIPLAQQIMKRLGASTQDNRLVQLIVAHHMRPGQLAHLDVVTPRAIRHYFVDLGPLGIQVALFSLADHIATVGPGWEEYSQRPESSWRLHLALVRLLLTRYIRERASILPARLVSAEELMRRLKLKPGPLIGQLLEYIAEAQAEERIHSKEEALWLAEEKLKMP
jgi:putative nucleotidyltransferase with HDIG domain